MAEILEEGGVVVAVADALVRHEGHVNVLALVHIALVVQLVCTALAAEGAEDGQVAEVIQVVVNGADAQGTHGGEEQGAVEGAQLQQEGGQQAEVIQQLQKPDGELHHQAGDVGEDLQQVIQAGIQLGGLLHTFHSGVELVVDVGDGVVGVQMDLDGGVGGVHAHLLLDDHAVLNVFTTGIDLLAGDEAVDLGILGDAPDVGGQQDVGDAEVLQTFPALLADVAVHMGDLKSLRKQVGAGVALHLEIGGDGRHGRQGADLAAVDAVAPGAVVLAIVVDADAEDHNCCGNQEQGVGQVSHDAGTSGDRQQGQQKPMAELPVAGNNDGVHDRHQNCDHPADPGADPDRAVNGHHPHGDGGLIELLVATEHYDEHVQQGCCDGQNDLAPRIQRIPGPFHTGNHQAGHCRANHAECHQPGQNAFAFDIKMVSLFHSTIIVTIP